MKKYKISICQITPSFNKEENIKKSISMIQEASDNGASLIVLPEIFYYPYDLAAIPEIAGQSDELLARFKDVAIRTKSHICLGTIAEKQEDKIYNKSYLINDHGNVVLEYSKTHLFDIHLENLIAEESKIFQRGENLPVVQTPLGNIGIIICYDLRFPEITRKLALQGAQLVLCPAAFSHRTGEVHWEPLCKSRAIENQIYFLAAAPGINPQADFKVYGHSLAIDPWGHVMAKAGQSEEIIYAEVDLDYLQSVRQNIPVYEHRRVDLYNL